MACSPSACYSTPRLSALCAILRIPTFPLLCGLSERQFWRSLLGTAGRDELRTRRPGSRQAKPWQYLTVCTLVHSHSLEVLASSRSADLLFLQQLPNEFVMPRPLPFSVCPDAGKISRGTRPLEHAESADWRADTFMYEDAVLK